MRVFIFNQASPCWPLHCWCLRGWAFSRRRSTSSMGSTPRRRSSITWVFLRLGPPQNEGKTSESDHLNWTSARVFSTACLCPVSCFWPLTSTTTASSSVKAVSLNRLIIQFKSTYIPPVNQEHTRLRMGWTNSFCCCLFCCSSRSCSCGRDHHADNVALPADQRRHTVSCRFSVLLPYVIWIGVSVTELFLRHLCHKCLNILTFA